MGKRIVMTSFGSLGDLNPIIAIAHKLQTRGHQVVIATSEFCNAFRQAGSCRANVESAGVEFHAVRSGWDLPAPTMNGQIQDPLRDGLLPYRHLRKSFDDLIVTVRGADLLITLSLDFAGPLVAGKTAIPWISIVLEPLSFFSAYEPLVPPAFPGLPGLPSLGQPLDEAVLRIGKLMVRPWGEPVRQLRAELGLPPGKDPFFEDYLTADLVLALFSSILGSPQPDWPPQTRVTGFVYYDRLGNSESLPDHLRQFLDAGPPPVVFTLGSDSALDPGSFYAESTAAARLLGCRAVLVGLFLPPLPHYQFGLFPSFADDVMTVSYAPFSELFPRAAVIVHHGGIGTTALALRAGRPMLVVPDSYAQPDTAARVTRLGVARTIPRHAYTGATAAAELSRLLYNPRYATTAAEVGNHIRAEDGVNVACDAIEERFACTIRRSASSR